MKVATSKQVSEAVETVLVLTAATATSIGKCAHCHADTIVDFVAVNGNHKPLCNKCLVNLVLSRKGLRIPTDAERLAENNNAVMQQLSHESDTGFGL